MLGTQNCSTRGLASTHCVLRLNFIKDLFKLYLKTYAHISIYLSCLSFHLIRTSKQTFIEEATSIYDKNLGISKFEQTYDIINTSKAYISTKHIHTHHQGEPICMLMWVYDLPHLSYCIKAPMASMYDHVNTCSWHQSKK